MKKTIITNTESQLFSQLMAEYSQLTSATETAMAFSSPSAARRNGR